MNLFQEPEEGKPLNSLEMMQGLGYRLCLQTRNRSLPVLCELLHQVLCHFRFYSDSWAVPPEISPQVLATAVTSSLGPEQEVRRRMLSVTWAPAISAKLSVWEKRICPAYSSVSTGSWLLAS